MAQHGCWQHELYSEESEASSAYSRWTLLCYRSHIERVIRDGVAVCQLLAKTTRGMERYAIIRCEVSAADVLRPS